MLLPHSLPAVPVCACAHLELLMATEEVSGSFTALTRPVKRWAEQPQCQQLLLTGILLQTLLQFPCPSLGTLQHLSVFLVVMGSKLNTEFEVSCFPGVRVHPLLSGQPGAQGRLATAPRSRAGHHLTPRAAAGAQPRALCDVPRAEDRDCFQPGTAALACSSLFPFALACLAGPFCEP